MSAASSPSGSGRRRWPKWLPWAGYSVLGVLGAGLAIYMAVITFGGVHGVEFSPQTFERRSYSFFEVPLIGIQVTGIKRDDVTSAAEMFLTSQKHIVPPKGVKPEWHIVVGSRGAKLLRKGDAYILMQYLDAKDGKDDHRWVKWSEDHPKLAAVFWPAVQQLAANDLYVFVPNLFDIAKAHDDPVKLQAALNRELVERLQFLAGRYQEREEHAEAVKVLNEALQLEPNNEKLKRARDTAKVAAGAKGSKRK